MASERFVGFVTLEGTLAFLVETENTSDVPTNADSTPTYAIYAPTSSGAGAVGGATGSLTAVETGVYRFSHSIAAAGGFAVGRYDIVVSYALSSANRKKVYSFNVV